MLLFRGVKPIPRWDYLFFIRKKMASKLLPSRIPYETGTCAWHPGCLSWEASRHGRSSHGAIKKRSPGGLGYIDVYRGWKFLPSYVGIISSTMIRIPSLNNKDSMESKRGFFVAHMYIKMYKSAEIPFTTGAQLAASWLTASFFVLIILFSHLFPYVFRKQRDFSKQQCYKVNTFATNSHSYEHD